MKSYIFFLLLCIIPINLAAQSGNGSSGNPFYGDISTNVTWSAGNFTNNEIYIGTSGTPNLRVISNGQLTIGEGLTIIFTQSNSNLIVTGSGVLNIMGISSEPVLLTKHSNNTRWGHVSFETPGSGTPITGTGSFEYAIFEYGYAATAGTDPSNAGGAIQINAKDVVIENCIFRYNYSNFGGAVTVNAGTDRNTIIRNSYFHDNIANQAGGALLTWTSSTPVIENCIFEANHCTGVGNTAYSGGAIWSLQNTTKIINCTFVENTSDRAGDAIYSYSSSNMRIINSIMWGSEDQFAGSSTSSTINYCAFEISKPANAANSITISATASDHFNDAGNSDWSIKYISPLRDAGTDSFTGATIPTTDYSGNSRVFTTDIGAYEVQYSRWKTSAGSTDWGTSANWDGGVPTATRDIVIPAGATNYPTGSSLVDVTIGSDKYFIMEPGSKATVDDLINNGTLRLESDATGISSLILNSFSGNPANVELFLTGGDATGGPKWHYISSPFVSLDTTMISATTRNLVRYIESMANPTTEAGWVNLRGYIYYSATSNPALGFGTLESGKGYNHYYTQNHEYTLSGALKTSDVVVTLEYTSDVAPNRYGFNLIGNPFSSGLDWDAISSDINYPASTSKALHYTRDNLHVYYNNGIGSDETVTGIIPPMQGFFVKTYNTSTSPKPSITLAASARTNSSIPARYKKSNESISHLRLKISDGTNGDNMVIRLDNSAKIELDYDFDAIKYSISSTFPSIYTHAGTTKLAINGLPFPDENVEMVLPVEIKIITGGSHSITATTIANLEDYKVRLRDLSNGTVVDLKEISTFNFNSDPGIIIGRFEILISKAITNDETLLAEEGPFKIYTNYGSIIIEPQSDLWENKTGSIVVTDFSGRSIRYIRQSEFLKGAPILVNEPDAEGLYIIDIQSGNLRYSRKIVIR